MKKMREFLKVVKADSSKVGTAKVYKLTLEGCRISAGAIGPAVRSKLEDLKWSGGVEKVDDDTFLLDPQSVQELCETISDAVKFSKEWMTKVEDCDKFEYWDEWDGKRYHLEVSYAYFSLCDYEEGITIERLEAPETPKKKSEGASLTALVERKREEVSLGFKVAEGFIEVMRTDVEVTPHEVVVYFDGVLHKEGEDVPVRGWVSFEPVVDPSGPELELKEREIFWEEV